MSRADLRHHDPMPVERLTPERRRELTRNALIEAAADVFAQRGFHGASLDEIAELAGFTRGAIYSHFASKADLLVGVVDLYTGRHSAAFADAQADGADWEPGRRAAAAAALWGQLIRRDPNLLALNLEFRLYALRNPSFRGRLAELDRRQSEAIAEVVEREARTMGLTLKMPAEDIADIMNATMIGLSEFAGFETEHAERYDRLAERFLVLIAGSIVESPVKAKLPRPPRKQKG